MSGMQDDTGQGERRLYVRLGGLLLLAALCYVVWRIVTPLWQPLLWAVLLGALLAPWNLRLTQRLGGRAQLASSITTALTAAPEMMRTAPRTPGRSPDGSLGR